MYNDVSRLRGRNNRFHESAMFVDLIFECRKTSHFHQGSTVTVPAIPRGVDCLVRLLRELQKIAGPNPTSLYSEDLMVT
jgi:hypothetical protein